jgi:superfamily II DNA or RNA helicase
VVELGKFDIVNNLLKGINLLVEFLHHPNSAGRLFGDMGTTFGILNNDIFRDINSKDVHDTDWVEIYPELLKIPKVRELILLKMDRDKVHDFVHCGDVPHRAKTERWEKKCETLSKINFKTTSHFSREFVKSIGLSNNEIEKYSGVDSKKGFDIIDLPQTKPNLRNYQNELVEQLTEYLESETKEGRLIHLPTGSGKTRICVEGIFQHAAKDNSKQLTILWINDKKELCRQAETSIREIYYDLGLKGQVSIHNQLCVISYYEGGVNENDFENSQGKLPDFRVIISTPDQMTRRSESQGFSYSWIKENIDIIVIDEAHLGVNEYWGIINDLDPGHRVALTATPDDDLKEQFTKLWPDKSLNLETMSIKDALVHERILAKVMNGGAEHIDISDHILENFGRDSMDNSLQYDHGFVDNPYAYRTIADVVIKNLTEQKCKSILVFVDHVKQARILSYIVKKLNPALNSAVVWGDMPSSDRRQTISTFRDGNIDVLFSINLLREGFDAPNVDCVIMANNTIDQSSQSYKQKIGRGLRGPESGGTEYCKIVHIVR